MKKTVSVIVPIYNQAHSLAQCLGNLANQTLENIEIILIDDASTDHSLSIMQQCETQFPDRIHILKSPHNLGAGGARNIGIEAAVGEYIGFVDSDDLPDPAMFEKLYDAAKTTGYDLIDCGYYRQETDTAILHTPDHCTGMLNAQKRSELIVSGGYIFSKLYRRELFADKQLRFRTHVILEDADFITYLLATVKSIGNIQEILYCYRNEPNSASKVVKEDQYYHQIYEAMFHIHQKTCCLPDYRSIQTAVEYELLQMYSYGVNICLKAYLNHSGYDVLKMLEDIADLKRKTVHGGYDNLYVRNKIDELDIKIMQLNDLNPKELLKSVSSEVC